MKIEFEQRGGYLIVHAAGQLDAAWSEYFLDTLLYQIRQGRHNLVIDATELSFLSSAGLRSLLVIHKELAAVKGGFIIVEANPFVERTLDTSGFQVWLAEGYPVDMPARGSGEYALEGDRLTHFVMNETAFLNASLQAGWRPWQAVDHAKVKAVSFPRDICCIGIGSAVVSDAEAQGLFGEFLSVAGNVVYQPPDEHSPPDYFISEKAFTPRMQCIQALSFKGEMRHLIRFVPTDGIPSHPVSLLLKDILDKTGGEAAGFVIMGEIHGLVGTSLIQSPGRITKELEMDFPEIREWLTFCGERSHAGQRALLTGFVSEKNGPFLPFLPDNTDDIATHIHGAVFPYQPLTNGRIELAESVERIFNGPPPLSVMHLTVDQRHLVGLGESALVRGACWFGPIENPEVLS